MDEKAIRYWAKAHEWHAQEAWLLIAKEIDPRDYMGDESEPMPDEDADELDAFLHEIAHFNGPSWVVSSRSDMPFMSKRPSEWLRLCRAAEMKIPDALREAIEGPSNESADQAVNVDRPLSTRQRRTLLTIVAALCMHGGLDPHRRGTAQRIREMTEEIGTPVDDGTIAKLLAEIPDALETRMK